MSEPKTAEGFIKQLNFKYKRFGGCDEEDVLIKMKELSDIYRQQIAEQKMQLSQWEQRVKELEQQHPKEEKKIEGSVIQFPPRDIGEQETARAIEETCTKMIEEKRAKAREEAKAKDREYVQVKEETRTRTKTPERARARAGMRALERAQERARMREQARGHAKDGESALAREERARLRAQERAQAFEQERAQALEQERAKALEQERVKALEQERAQALEQERVKALEQERAKALEQERAKALEQERVKALEQERAQALEQERVKALEQERAKAKVEQRASKAEAEETYSCNRQIDNMLYSTELSKQDILKKVKAETMREAEQLRQETNQLRRRYHSISMDMKHDGILAVSELNEILDSLTKLKKKIEDFNDMHVPKEDND